MIMIMIMIINNNTELRVFTIVNGLSSRAPSYYFMTAHSMYTFLLLYNNKANHAMAIKF